MLIDLHTHSMYSYDADKLSLCQHVQSAVEHGMDVVGFSEHVDYFYKESIQASDFPPEKANFEMYAREVEPFRRGRVLGADLTAQQNDIRTCRNEFADRITLRAGVEMGQPHAAPDLADRLLEKYHFDYVIGSIHHLSDDMDMYFYHYENVDPDAFLNTYFDEMEAMLRYGRFHILAHMDYPLRVMKLPHNQPSLKDYMDRVDIVLKMLIERGIALECNTKGILGWQQEVGPERFILERYHELGGEYITVGSDSHTPDRIGFGIAQAIERMRAVGFLYVTDFQDGRAIQHKL